MMGKLVRFLLLVIALPLVYALVVDAYLLLRAEIALSDLRWFLYGFVPTLLIYLPLTLSRHPNITFINTFRHELTHAFVSTLFLQFPRWLIVDLRQLQARRGAGRQVAARRSTRRRPSTHGRSARRGPAPRRRKVGQVPVGETGPAGGGFVNALAPYYLPLFTLPLLLLRPFAPGVVVNIVDVLIGATYAFHVVTAGTEFRLYQTDITRTGVIFSFVFVLLMNVILLTIILLVVSGNYAAIATYFRAAWARAQAAYGSILEWIDDELLPALRRFWEDVRPEGAAFFDGNPPEQGVPPCSARHSWAAVRGGAGRCGLKSCLPGPFSRSSGPCAWAEP